MWIMKFPTTVWVTFWRRKLRVFKSYFHILHVFHQNFPVKNSCNIFSVHLYSHKISSYLEDTAKVGNFFNKPDSRKWMVAANVLGNCVLYLQRCYIDCGMRNMHIASHYQNIILQAKNIQRAKRNQEMRVANNDVCSSVKYVFLQLCVRIYFHSLRLYRRHRRRRHIECHRATIISGQLSVLWFS